MYQVIELVRADPRPLFRADEERRYFMGLADKLGRRWGVRPRAFRLGRSWAAFLVEGSSSHWCRLLQSGYAVWRFHRHDPMIWRPAIRVPLPDEGWARRAADTLHRGPEPDPLLTCWSSLRDGLRLRDAPWFDGGWLADAGAPALYEGAGGRDRLPRSGVAEPTGWSRMAPRDDWGLIEAAVEAATGRAAEARGVGWLRTQVAWARGWSVPALARRLSVQPLSVRRSLQRVGGPALERALLHLEDGRLRLSLGEPAGGPVKGWDLPEPPWSRLHSYSSKPAPSSPVA